jgi:hypothetical protein
MYFQRSPKKPGSARMTLLIDLSLRLCAFAGNIFACRRRQRNNVPAKAQSRKKSNAFA